MDEVKVSGPVSGMSADCERILRSLPKWFGIEQSLLMYANDSERFPTFLAQIGGQALGFLTAREHFPESWEVHCIAIYADRRGRGIGRKLHEHVENWIAGRGAKVLQVKTMDASHPSSEYAETRKFYAALGYVPLETFPALWGPTLPALQLIRWLGNRAASV